MDVGRRDARGGLKVPGPACHYERSEERDYTNLKTRSVHYKAAVQGPIPRTELVADGLPPLPLPHLCDVVGLILA